MKTLTKILISSLLLLMFVLISENVMADAKEQGPPPARVVTAPVIEESVAENTTIVGTLFFDQVSQLSTDVSGLASSVSFREGDIVKKGDQMLTLNTDFIKNEIDSVRSTISQIKVRLKKAQKDLKRYETLYKQEAASEKEYDDMAMSKEDLVKQKAILQKSLELARLKKRKSVITAPFDGIILEKKTAVGNWVSPGSVLCTLASVDNVFAKVPVSEDLLKFSNKGEEVSVSISALGKTFPGIIDGIIPIADPQTKTVFIKIKLPRLENAVLNMSATVSLPIGDKKNMLLIPRDALINFNGQNMVYTIKEGKAEPMPVKIVSYMGEYAAVNANGLQKGMPVVVDGNDRLRPGQAVVVIKN